MSLKTAFIAILALVIGIGGGLYVGHRWGSTVGWTQGREEGYRKGRLDSNIADCVYLTMSFRKDRGALGIDTMLGSMPPKVEGMLWDIAGANWLAFRV